LSQKSKKFELIEKAIESNGLKFVVLLRLTPIFPFNLLNYFLGAISISAKDNMIAYLGMLPWTVVYVYIGTTLKNIAEISKSGT